MALYAFDGTNDDDSSNTNVWRFYSNYDAQTRREGISNIYVPGVGTRFGPIGKVVGGAVGAGWLDRIMATYESLCAAYAGGDKIIDVVGFSRGSAIALDFVNKVASDGIRHNGAVIEAHPAIRFLGLFDVVAAFGVANLGFVFAKIDIGHRLSLPANVKHCFHAMALDEKRPQFAQTRVRNGYEVWFRGVHSDIGGGNGNTGLNNVALRWMYRKALAAGLPIAMDIEDAAVKPDAAIDPNFFDKLSVTWRPVDQSETVHYTVAERDRCNRYPANCPVESHDFEQHRLAKPQA